MYTVKDWQSPIPCGSRPTPHYPPPRGAPPAGQPTPDVVPGPTGLIIRRREGRATIAWAVQKDNLSTRLHKRTHADEVAETLMKMADERNRRGPRSGLRLDIGPG